MLLLWRTTPPNVGWIIFFHCFTVQSISSLIKYGLKWICGLGLKGSDRRCCVEKQLEKGAQEGIVLKEGTKKIQERCCVELISYYYDLDWKYKCWSSRQTKSICKVSMTDTHIVRTCIRICTRCHQMTLL